MFHLSPPPKCLKANSSSFQPGNPLFLTPVEDDVLVSQTAVLHSTGQASRLSSCHFHGYSEIPRAISIGQDITSLSARLLLVTPHPCHQHRLWVEARHTADQQQTTRTRTGATGQPGFWLHCRKQKKCSHKLPIISSSQVRETHILHFSIFARRVHHLHCRWRSSLPASRSPQMKRGQVSLMNLCTVSMKSL